MKDRNQERLKDFDLSSQKDGVAINSNRKFYRVDFWEILGAPFWT